MIFYYLLIIFVASNLQIVNGRNMTEQFERSLEFLENAIRFLKEAKSELNLDGLVGVRFGEDMISPVLKHEPEIFGDFLPRVEQIRNDLKKISDDGMEFVEETEPKYAAALGRGMKDFDDIWYPRIATDPARYLEVPVACEDSFFNETISDKCLGEVVNNCSFTQDCIDWELTRNMREYRINHQLLFWQMSEKVGCLTLPDNLRVYFCTNLLRDAKRVAEAGYPNGHRDMFNEQLGFCFPWGFYEFYVPEWVDAIISWQHPEGCLKNYAYPWHCIDENGELTKERVKREERPMRDGCLSHKTGSGVGAIAGSLRFQAEDMYNNRQNSV